MKISNVEMISRSCIEPAVNAVRVELAKKFDVDEGPYREYRGLCDEACRMFKEKMNEFNDKFGYHIKTYIVHGEQKHLPRIHSTNWYLQHTWCYIVFGKYKIYVDPTSSQFKCLYNNIPDYYISTKKPKWYYPDKDNPCFKGITKKINNKYSITHKEKYENTIYYHEENFIEFFQYVVWGKISDFIYDVIHK